MIILLFEIFIIIYNYIIVNNFYCFSSMEKCTSFFI